MQTKHQPTVAQIVNRKAPTWQDCVEIAEVALYRMYRLGPRERDDLTHRLAWAVLSAGGIDHIYIPEFGDMSVDEAKAVIR